MKRHKNLWLSTFDDENLKILIDQEQARGLTKGKYNSAHEMAAVIREEFEEFWESVKEDDPDPNELLHICATTKRAIVELCERARYEMQQALKERI